jgi:excisionase family DNA binding protein
MVVLIRDNTIYHYVMGDSDLPQDLLDQIRREYPTILTTAHVAEMMHCTIGDVRDKVHAQKLPAMRWGQQFRFFRDEVIAAMQRVNETEDEPDAIEDQAT